LYVAIAFEKHAPVVPSIFIISDHHDMGCVGGWGPRGSVDDGHGGLRMSMLKIKTTFSGNSTRRNFENQNYLLSQLDMAKLWKSKLPFLAT
jgi:hypothetical protein